ncbi:DUF1549 and DUF1553 domain-containing protein [Luteolibacter arcticus]|uniref:DUF1549 and DUF1553 domain-containing protein n=1 Tax=Luteolibacter arcticus TaxID=1581411 RepID=A0ABT3GQF9_9BACT|nr:DUF1549 and DUF1553 domain-containing protein [Luteolibacter arcticus]MCW1925759.1 DUF1549 and DUF1553 domain-containing protein [Luteolibacter arcticus]
MRAALASAALLMSHALVVAAEHAPAFQSDVLPVLTRAGCNAGACHGAASGQGGFRLSLFGYDPESDYERITREFGGRRIDLARPEDSLLLRKASETEVDHEGGRKLREGSNNYALIREWIAAGAPAGPPDLQVTGIAVEPQDLLARGSGETRQIVVTATLSDGSKREVSPLALYTANDDAVAGVTKSGKLTVTGRGLTSIMVRYGGQVAAVRVAAPLEGAGMADDGFRPANFIDEHIRAEFVRLHVSPASLCDDAEFLRRAYLDLTGRLPDEAITRAFLNEPASAERRMRLIDELLGSEAFVDFWTMKLADLVLLNGQGGAAKSWHGWLREQVAGNVSFDQVAITLVTASGNPATNGPAGFMNLATDPRDLSEHVARIFLGLQIGCARCHAHPADRWTQEDYHRFAAFFARLSRDGGVVRAVDRGEVDHPKSGLPLEPRALGASDVEIPQGSDRRLALAAWMTDPANPFFARTVVNRVWKHLLGRGLVEPVDDLRPTNPATHPALLDALAADFSAHGHDLRRLIRLIAASRTWQLASHGGSADPAAARLFARALHKELPAAVFADAVAQVTGVPDTFAGVPAGTRAVQLISPATPSPALDVLGRCERKRACDSSSRSGGGLAQALHLINGSTINDKLAAGLGLAAELPEKTNREVIETLYLRAFSRYPSPGEMNAWDTVLPAGEGRPEAVADLVWVVLNSREFSANH